MAQLGEHTSDDPQQRHCAMVVLNVGRLHQHVQQRTFRIGDDMTLAPLDALSHVKPTRAATFRGLCTLAIDNPSGRHEIAPLPFAHPSNQRVVHRVPETRSTPFVEIIPNRRTRRKVFRQRAPLASRRRDVEDRVHDHAKTDFAWPTTSAPRRHKRLNDFPLLIRHVACVAQSIATILFAGDFSPRHLCLHRISQIRRNHNRLKSLNLFFELGFQDEVEEK